MVVLHAVVFPVGLVVVAVVVVLTVVDLLCLLEERDLGLVRVVAVDAVEDEPAVAVSNIRVV